MPKTIDNKDVSNQISETKAVTNEDVVTFKKPYKFEGQDYNSIDLSPLHDLKAQDLIDADRIFSSAGNFASLPEMNLGYCLVVASTATKKPSEFFENLPAPEAVKVKNKVMGFLNN